MGREVHGADIEDGGLVLFVLNSGDLLQVVLSAVVPSALQPRNLHVALVAPHALHPHLRQLRLALRERNSHCVLVEGFHCFGLVLLALYLGFQLFLDRRHALKVAIIIEILGRNHSSSSSTIE